MKKCYTNPQIIVVPIRPRPIMQQASGIPEGEYDGWDAKGIYGSWEADDEDE